MVTNPPKRIRKKGLLDPVAAIRLESKDPRRRNSHTFEIDEKGAIKILPDTSVGTTGGISQEQRQITTIEHAKMDACPSILVCE
jgi:hypothetical protein